MQSHLSFTCISRCALMGAALLLTLPAHADDAPNQRAVLFSVGQTQQATGDSVAELTGQGYTAITYQADKTATSGSIGYRHPLAGNWSADVQYLNFGEAKPTLIATLPVGKTNAQAAQDMADSLPQRGHKYLHKCPRFLDNRGMISKKAFEVLISAYPAVTSAWYRNT